MRTALAPGQLLDERYTLDHELGEDAHGTIWEAFDQGLGRSVGLHEIRFPGDGPYDAVLRDGLATARKAIRVHHPGAIHVYDAFIDGDRLMVVSELTFARSLDALVSRKGPLPYKRVAAIAVEVLEPLAAAHATGVVHGSIDARSVLVPEKAHSLLTGFGMPTRRDTTVIADLRSLGAALYFAAQGDYPGDPAEAPSRAPKLWPILERMLAPDPESPPAIDDLRRELAEVAGIRLDEDGNVVVRKPRRRRRAHRNDAGADDSEATGNRGAVEVIATDAVDVDDVDEPQPATEAEHDWDAVVTDATPETWVDWSPDAEPAENGESHSAGNGAEVALVPAASVSAAEAAAEKEEEQRYRSTPSWPPPTQRRSFFLLMLCGWVIVVMVGLLLTNGQFGRPRVADEGSTANRPELTTDPEALPGDWIAYRHPVVDFAISHPPGWQLREEGTLLQITDPTTGTELRVDAHTPTGGDPHDVALLAERNFSARHPETYRRLQMSPATYLGHRAALWEYTYSQRGDTVHAADLSFTVGKQRFNLLFQAPDDAWQDLLPTFRGFLSSVRA